MQEANFPPALLVGMEGLYGLAFALALYFPLAPLAGEEPSNVADDVWNDDGGIMIGLSIIGWTILVTISGVFCIASSDATSSMTRNVWKNVRTCLVWIIGLIIYYASGDPDLGEEWHVPGSIYVSIGFAVMSVGILTYYGKGSHAGSKVGSAIVEVTH